MKNLYILLIAVVCSPVLMAQAPYGNAGDHTIVPIDNDVFGTFYGFVEYLPPDFVDDGTKYPLVLSFPGIGEAGNGSSSQLSSKMYRMGFPKLAQGGKEFPFIGIAPQSASGWYNTGQTNYLLNNIIANYPIDEDRIYLMGLSAGGKGVMEYVNQTPERIAAVVGMCVAGPPPQVDATHLQSKPIWLFTNAGDATVTWKSQTKPAFDRISGGLNISEVYDFDHTTGLPSTNQTVSLILGSPNTMTVEDGIIAPTEPNKLAVTFYNKNGHDGWTATFANDDVWDWMLSQSLNGVITKTQELAEGTEEFKLFPNPAQSECTLHLGTQQANVTLMDVKGQVVSDLGEGISGQVNFSTAQLTPGIYHLKITTTEDSITKSLVIE